MTVQERKYALIHWLTEVEDVRVIEQIEIVQQSADQIPEKIELLLDLSMRATGAECVEHSSIKVLLDRT